jgi:hypothetical protein
MIDSSHMQGACFRLFVRGWGLARSETVLLLESRVSLLSAVSDCSCAFPYATNRLILIFINLECRFLQHEFKKCNLHFNYNQEGYDNILLVSEISRERFSVAIMT